MSTLVLSPFLYIPFVSSSPYLKYNWAPETNQRQKQQQLASWISEVGSIEIGLRISQGDKQRCNSASSPEWRCSSREQITWNMSHWMKSNKTLQVPQYSICRAVLMVLNDHYNNSSNSIIVALVENSVCLNRRSQSRALLKRAQHRQGVVK